MTTIYQELLEQARQNPGAADYHALRMAYTDTEDYEPNQRNQSYLDALREAHIAGNWQEVLNQSNYLLYENYLDVEAHQWAKAAYEQLGSVDFANFHDYFSTALLESVQASGDGLSVETSFTVIDPQEAYALLRHLGLEAQSQRETLQGGENYLCLTVTPPGAGPQAYYFRQPWKAFSAPELSAPSIEPVVEEAAKEEVGTGGVVEAEPPSAQEPVWVPSYVVMPNPSEVDQMLRQHNVHINPSTGSALAKFHELTSSAKNRLLEIQRQESDFKIKEGGVASALIVASIGVLLLLFLVGALADSSQNHPVIVFAFLGFFVLMCLDWGVGRLLRHFRSNVGRHFYPDSSYLLHIRHHEVEAWPYLRLDLERSALTHRHNNNVYRESELYLSFGGESVSIRFPHIESAEAFLTYLQQQQALALDAWEQNALHQLEGLELMATNTKASAPKKWLRPVLWLVGAVALAFALMPLHAVMADHAEWDKAQARNTPYGYEQYLKRFPQGRHLAEAKKGYDKASWDKYRKKNKASALRTYLAAFPNGGYRDQAKAKIREMSDEAIRRYRRKTLGRSSASKAMLKVLRHLRDINGDKVYIQYLPKLEFTKDLGKDFSRRVTAALDLQVKRSFRTTLKRKGALRPASVTLAFTKRDNENRENFISTAISSAFGSVIPQGVLGFYPKKNPPQGASVVFQIQYRIRRKYISLKAAMLYDTLAQLRKMRRLSRRARRRYLRRRKKAYKAEIARYQLTPNAKGKVMLPSIYVQSRTTRYRTGRSYRRPVRTLFGIEVDWVMRILVKGEKVLELPIASDTASRVRLRSGQTSVSYAYKRMAESAFTRFASKLQRSFGVRAGVDAQLFRFLWDMPPRFRKQYFAYSSSMRKAKLRVLWKELERFHRSMPYHYRSKSSLPYKKRRKVIELWDWLDKRYESLRERSRLRKHLRLMSPYHRRLYLIRAIDRSRRRGSRYRNNRYRYKPKRNYRGGGVEDEGSGTNKKVY